MIREALIIFLLFFISFSYAQEIDELDVQKMNTISKKFLLQNKIPGMSVSISEKDKIIFSEGFGFSNIKTKNKVLPSSTKFRIASISKTLTALALAKLVDDKLLNFDNSLYNYVSDFSKKKYDFSIRQIGGHLAGIRHYKNKEFLLNKEISIIEGLDIFKNDPLLFKPGKRFNYSTYGWNLLSVVIQNASNQDYFSYMENSIFKPLNMINTHAEHSENEYKNTTKFYIKRNQKIRIGPTVNNKFKAAGGGFLSTSEDLIKFGYQFIKPSIISEHSLNELVNAQKTDDGKSTKYGIGISVSKTKNGYLRFSHSGGGVGASTYLLIYPEQEIIISILTNLSGANLRNYIRKLELILIE